MDPITISTSALTTTGICLGAAKRLYGLVDKYRHASRTIAAIYSESMVIGASLRQLQHILAQNEEVCLQQFQNRSDLSDVFEAALLGCSLVYSCLDDEVQRLMVPTNDANETNRLARARFLWREETMRELLQSIRAQNAAISLLLQCLQVETVSSMRKTLEDVRQMVTDMNNFAVTSAQSHPGVAEALLEDGSTPCWRQSQVAFSDGSSVEASVLGLAPSTKFQSPRQSVLSNVSDNCFDSSPSMSEAVPRSLASDLIWRLSRRFSDNCQLEDALPGSTLDPTMIPSIPDVPSILFSLTETQERESHSSIDEYETDQGHASCSDALDNLSITFVAPPDASASHGSQLDHLQEETSTRSTPSGDLQDDETGEESSSPEPTIGSYSAESPHSQIQDDRSMMIGQAVDRFMNRLSLGCHFSAGTSDIQHQGRRRQLSAPLPANSSTNQPDSSSRKAEPLPTSASVVESKPAELAIFDHLQRLSSPGSSQQIVAHQHETNGQDPGYRMTSTTQLIGFCDQSHARIYVLHR